MFAQNNQSHEHKEKQGNNKRWEWGLIFLTYVIKFEPSFPIPTFISNIF